MPAGLPYFAWIDASETTFTSGHMRWDEEVFSFTLSQEEGDPASLTAVVRRPKNTAGDAIGLLGPGRKIWAWFALDCGPALFKFRGRLVGIPTSIFEELVTLEFVAKPTDLVAQKEALAATLRVLPFYDEAVIDPSRANDPDVVLEGYTKVFHYDRETHLITVSDEISGEDGIVEFDGISDTGKVLYDGLALTLTSGPLARVDVQAEYTWTQQASGTVDLTNYLIGAWPDTLNGAIKSYTLTAADWPKSGTGIGDGWVVASSSARDLADHTVKSRTESASATITMPDGSGGTSSATQTISYIGSYPGTMPYPEVTLSDSWSATYSTDEDGLLYVSSFTRNFSGVHGVFAVNLVAATLVAGYTAERQCTEHVSFSLFADVQPILTDPEDGEALRVDDVRSINLTEGGQIGDPRRRSYITTARGNQSLEYLIVLARAHLMKRARVVEIACVPKLARMPEITLRKNLFLVEPRVNEALGKIIGYSIALDGSDGQIKCEVRFACAIGRGGAAVTTDGTPTYCSIAYAGADYQEFLGRTVLVESLPDSSVGYAPPVAAPNDDGVNFLSALSARDVIEEPLTVTFGPDAQVDNIESSMPSTTVGLYNSPVAHSPSDPQDIMAARAEYFKNVLASMETHATFKLKPMTGAFTTDYEIQLTDLKIPTGYDLEAV